jgi:hypothetical protein
MSSSNHSNHLLSISGCKWFQQMHKQRARCGDRLWEGGNVYVYISALCL